eukprot:2293885-Pyramimonas_sp.AAC.1
MLRALCGAVRRNDTPCRALLCISTLSYVKQHINLRWMDTMVYHALRYSIPCHDMLRRPTLRTDAP